jgi:hypothetical protein
MHLDLGRAARRAEMSQRILRSYLRPVAALLEEGAADGTMRPVTSPRVAAAALLGATTTAVEQALLSADEPSGPDPSVIALYEPIMSLVLHGLGTAEEAPALYAEGLNS